MAYLRLRSNNLNQSQRRQPQPTQRYTPRFERGTWHLYDALKNHATTWAPGEVLYLYSREDAWAAAHDFNLMDSIRI